MIRWFQLLCMRSRCAVLEAQADDAEDLILDHTRRYEMLCDRIRKIKGRIALLTPAHKLLADVPKSGVVR